jgi:phosphoglycolate phosphatase
MREILIFDYDGVIVDSLSIFMNSFITACHQQGYPQIASKEEFLRLFEGNMFEKMFDHGMKKETILKIVNTLKKELLLHQEEIEFFPNIQSVLQKLSEDHTLLISTSNETSLVETFLKKKNMDNLFQGIYGSDIEPSKVKKIQMVQREFNHASYTYIGDTVGDIKEAKIADINTVAVTWGWHKFNQLKKVHPNSFAHHPSDLLSLFTE